MNRRRAAAVLAAAGLGILLGCLVYAILAGAVSGQRAGVGAASPRDAANLAGDIEAWLRAEGY